jgi:hypothetical protein
MSLGRYSNARMAHVTKNLYRTLRLGTFHEKINAVSPCCHMSVYLEGQPCQIETYTACRQHFDDSWNASAAWGFPVEADTPAWWERALSIPLRFQSQYIDEHMTISHRLNMRILYRGPGSFPCRAYNH